MKAVTGILCSILTLIGSTGVAQEASRAPGLVVEHVIPSTVGVNTGDLLLTWQVENADPATTAFQHPFDIDALNLRSLGGERVVLVVESSGGQRTVVLPAGEWLIDTRPNFIGDALSGYREGARLVGAGDHAQAVSAWRSLRDEHVGPDDPDIRLWLDWKLGNALYAAGDHAASNAVFANMSAGIEAIANPEQRAAFYENLAAFYHSVWRAAEASTAWSRALEIRRSFSTADSRIAKDLQGLGDAALMQRNLDAAEEYLDQALAIRERRAPDSLAAALSQKSLAFVALQRRDLPNVERHVAAALKTTSTTYPQGLIHAETLRVQGVVMSIKGDAEAARRLWLQALAGYRIWAPGSIGESRVLSNIGIAAWQTGDLVVAERYFRQALNIIETLAPGSPPHAGYLNNLGLIYHRRYEFGRARLVYERASEIFEARAPDSLELARSLTNVALAYGLGGEPERALEQLRRVLEIQQRLQPGSTDIAQTWHAIGLNHERAGDLEAATKSFRTALRLREELLPQSLSVAVSAHSLGNVRAKLGDDAEAETLHDIALRLYRRLSPNTTEEAQALHAIGVIHRDRGDAGAALAHFREAIDAIERQTSRLGGSEEARGSFSARFANFYKDYIQLLLQDERHDEAFQYLERYRARMLREMLAERDVGLDAEVPEELRTRRRDADQRYERAMDRLRRLSDTEANAEEIDALLEQLATEQIEREAIAAEIRESTPRRASRVYTETVTADAVAAALDDDSVLLSYCVTSSSVFVFVVRPATDLEVITIAAGHEQLVSELGQLRLLMQAPDAGPDVAAGLMRKSHELYGKLLAPLLEDTLPETRLIILPDGPLHTLPFAALVTNDDADSPRFLLERHPLHTALSAALHVSNAEKPEVAGAPPRITLAAFGDPIFEARDGDAAGAAHDPSISRGRSLGPLPLSRIEVETIARLFPGRANVYVGVDATEAALKRVAPDARYLHIASHGVLDAAFPLSSYVALTAPDDADFATENGLLHAWEVLEQLRLKADLVVLSACETGLGRESGGEGLLGLSWAFRYAGAKSVLASLWPVPDRSTSELMTRFYENVESGMATDEALRAAQRVLIEAARPEGLIDRIRAWIRPDVAREPTIAHPYYWAAFQLAGLGE